MMRRVDERVKRGWQLETWLPAKFVDAVGQEVLSIGLGYVPAPGSITRQWGIYNFSAVVHHY